MPGTAPSRRGRETRLRILDAAVELFTSPGFRATSLRDIAAHADISHAGLARHYTSKDEILLAVLARMSAVLPSPDSLVGPNGSIEPLRAHARRISAHPHLVALVTTLHPFVAEPTHPARPAFLARHHRRLELCVETFGIRDMLGAGRRPDEEARMFTSVWDGAQLMALFDAQRVDLESTVSRYIEELHHDRIAEPSADRRPPATPDGAGDRRTAILDAALESFAARGYIDTTMRDVAETAGVAKATLFHHFATKEELLSEALDSQDDEVAVALPTLALTDARSALATLADRAGAPARVRTASLAYAHLLHESAPCCHPVHDEMSSRLFAFVSFVAYLFRLAAEQGTLPRGRSPEHEATVFVGMWIGALVQQMYEPDEVDAATMLRRHLSGLLGA